MGEGIGEKLPGWIREADVVEFPDVNSAVVSKTVLPGIGSMVVTDSGLEMLGDYLQSPEKFVRFLDHSAHDTRAFRGIGNLREVGDSMLLKFDVAKEPIETVLTHQMIDALVPRETEDYVYDPVRYHLGVNLPGLYIILMDRVQARPIMSQDQSRSVYTAWKRFSAEAASHGIRIIGTMGDVLHRDMVDRNGVLVPKIAIVDQVVPGIHADLAKAKKR